MNKKVVVVVLLCSVSLRASMFGRQVVAQPINLQFNSSVVQAPKFEKIDAAPKIMSKNSYQILAKQAVDQAMSQPNQASGQSVQEPQSVNADVSIPDTVRPQSVWSLWLSGQKNQFGQQEKVAVAEKEQSLSDQSLVTPVEPVKPVATDVVVKSAVTQQSVGVPTAQSPTGQVADMSQKSPSFKALQEQVKAKFSQLSDVDVYKITQLVELIKQENVSQARELLSNDKYKELKSELYPEGLPGEGGIKPADLMQLSSGQSEATAQVGVLGGIAGGGISLHKAGSVLVKKTNPLLDGLQQARNNMQKSSGESFLFTNKYSEQLAQDRWVSKVRDDLIKNITQEAETQFNQQSPALRSAFQEKYKDKSSQPNFEDKISELMMIEKENRLKKALSDAAPEIAQAVQKAQNEFADKVAQAKAQYESSRSKQSQDQASGLQPQKETFNQVMFKKNKVIAERQAETRAKNAIAQQVEANLLSQKDSWQHDYSYENPRSDVQAAWNKFVASKVEEAYRKPDNVAAIKKAQDDAVAALQSASPVSVTKGSRSQQAIAAVA